MNDVVVFSGFNALVAVPDRTRFLNVPNVQLRLNQASAILTKDRAENINLLQYCSDEKNDLYNIENAPLTAASITAIQVGLFDEVQSKINPDAWFMGCSLGDIARSINAGSINFEDIISSFGSFSELTKVLENIGFNSVIYTVEPFSEEQFQYLKSLDLSISIMSPYFINIAGSNNVYEEITKYTAKNRWRFQKILNFPAHSSILENSVRPFWEKLPKKDIQQPKFKLFSSLSCKELTDPNEIQDEVYLNMITPVRWAESVEYLIKNHNVNRMINIGPCESLPKITKRSGHNLNFINAMELK